MIMILRDYSFIDVNGSNISLHILLQEVIKIQMSMAEKDRFITLILDVLYNEIPAITCQHAVVEHSFSEISSLVSHANVFCHYAIERTINPKKLINLLIDASDFRGRTEENVDEGSAMLERADKLIHCIPNELSTIYNDQIAKVRFAALKDSNNWNKAVRDLTALQLEAQKKLSKIEFIKLEELLLYELMRLHIHLRNFDEADKIYKAYLKNHNDTGAYAHEIAWVYHYKADYDKAIELLRLSLKLKDEFYKTSINLQSAITRSLLGFFLSVLGQIEEAIFHLKISLNINNTIRSDLKEKLEHPFREMYLGEALFRAGDYRKAKEIFETLFSKMKQQFNKDKLFNNSIILSISKTYCQLGMYKPCCWTGQRKN